MKIPCLFVSKKWTKAFLWSHILGWTLANIQTIWIVWEIKKLYKDLKINKNMK